MFQLQSICLLFRIPFIFLPVHFLLPSLLSLSLLFSYNFLPLFSLTRHDSWSLTFTLYFRNNYYFSRQLFPGQAASLKERERKKEKIVTGRKKVVEVYEVMIILLSPGDKSFCRSFLVWDENCFTLFTPKKKSVEKRRRLSHWILE